MKPELYIEIDLELYTGIEIELYIDGETGIDPELDP